MEKLEPILKQKFWILLGIGMIMTITGWWMATGTLANTIKTRTDAVQNAFKRIPSGEIPNNTWSSQLASRNTEQQKAVNTTKAYLWDIQQQKMTWPEGIFPEKMPDAMIAGKVAYRGDIPLSGREDYRLSYATDVRRVWEVVDPFKVVDGSGIVVFGVNEKVLPQRTWGAIAPLPAEMWDAQEDLWLMESLLQSITSVNGGKGIQRNDASIHVLERLELFGGQPANQRKAGGGSPGGTAGPSMTTPGSAAGGAHGSAMAPPGSGGFGGAGPGGGMGGMSGTGGLANIPPLPPVDFDRRDEVGDDGSGSGRAGGGGGMGGSSMMSMGPAGGHSAGPPAGPGASGGGAAAANNVRRYVDDDAALPFKTRGFYMTLIMDHRKIPSLIAELSASEKSGWPAEILRVQMVRLHDDDVGSGAGSAGFGGGMTAGFGGGKSGFNLQSLLSPSGTGMGAGPAGFPGASSYEREEGSGSFTPPFSGATSGAGPGAPGAAGTASPQAAGIAALESSLQDPNMARVAICGIITLYKEVKPDPAAAPSAPVAPVVAPATATGEAATTPAAEGTPAENGTDPATPKDGDTPDSKPADKPETPADPAAPATTPETPANPPAPGTGKEQPGKEQ